MFFIVGVGDIHYCNTYVPIVLFVSIDYMCVLHHCLACSLNNFVLCCVVYSLSQKPIHSSMALYSFLMAWKIHLLANYVISVSRVVEINQYDP